MIPDVEELFKSSYYNLNTIEYTKEFNILSSSFVMENKAYLFINIQRLQSAIQIKICKNYKPLWPVKLSI